MGITLKKLTKRKKREREKFYSIKMEKEARNSAGRRKKTVKTAQAPCERPVWLQV